MKKFIRRTLYFFIPIIFIHLFTFAFYNHEKGDLLRLGYVFDLYPNYRDTFKNDFNNPIKFTSISEQPANKSFKILTIGDSYSDQMGWGYKNLLANDFSVLHIDRFISRNQVETLSSLINGDFFDTYHFEYVILQNAERHYIDNIDSLNSQKTLTVAELSAFINAHKPKKEDLSYTFPSSRAVKFPYYSAKYFLFDDCVLDGQVGKARLVTDELFSNRSSDLLFYEYDRFTVANNNDSSKVSRLNDILNSLSDQLKKKNVKLIILPSPDKYDLYYDFIQNKSQYIKPNFFSILNTMDKRYQYIDSPELLKKAIREKRDVYFYDDTHWSPVGARIIADEIKRYIN